MEIAKSNSDLNKWLKDCKTQFSSIGFVPTMGALHDGHLSLINRSLQENDFTVVSVFVNPKQFNNPLDLERYPRTLEKDIDLLSSLQHEKMLLYVPSEQDVYAGRISFNLDLGILDKVLEGKYRPGHFTGVAHVVHNLFELVNPDVAYFGKKDFQQLAVIRHLVREMNLKVNVEACPTLRSDEGLALSSRNNLLSEQERLDALVLSRALNQIQQLGNYTSPQEAKEEGIRLIKESNLTLEYLELINGHTFDILQEEWGSYPVCCIAAMCGDVRLIDNMELQFD
jgi:pantoate--beta-alanine ligase